MPALVTVVLLSVENSKSCASDHVHCEWQVPWHAVLGNHDYGECWTGEDCAAIMAQCGGQQGCFLSPLHQVSLLPMVDHTPFKTK